MSLLADTPGKNNVPGGKEYRKLWMRRWNQKRRKQIGPDRRSKNGKSQLRAKDGKFSIHKDDVR